MKQQIMKQHIRKVALALSLLTSLSACQAQAPVVGQPLPPSQSNATEDSGRTRIFGGFVDFVRNIGQQRDSSGKEAIDFLGGVINTGLNTIESGTRDAVNQALNSGAPLYKAGEAIVVPAAISASQATASIASSAGAFSAAGITASDLSNAKIFKDIKSGADVLIVGQRSFTEGIEQDGLMFINGALRDARQIAEGSYSNGRVWSEGAWKDVSSFAGTAYDAVASSSITQGLLDELLGRNIKGARWLEENLMRSTMDVHFHEGILNVSTAESESNRMMTRITEITNNTELSPERVLTDVITAMSEGSAAADRATPALVFELNYYAAAILGTISREFEAIGVVDDLRNAFDPNSEAGISDPAYWLNRLFEVMTDSMMDPQLRQALEAEQKKKDQRDAVVGAVDSFSPDSKQSTRGKSGRYAGKKAFVKRISSALQAICSVYGPWIRQSNKGNGIFLKVSYVPGLLTVRVVPRPASPNSAPQILDSRQGVMLPPDKVALKADNGKYISARIGANEDKRLQATQTQLGDWETFNLEYLGGNQVALKADNGMYIASELGGWDEYAAQHQLKQVAIGANGEVFALNSAGHILKYNGSGFERVISCCGLEKITVTRDGKVWGFDGNNKVYEGFFENGGGLLERPGLLKDISAGADGSLWGIGMDDKVWTWDGQNWQPQVRCCTLSRIIARPNGRAWGIGNNTRRLYDVYLENGGGIIDQNIDVTDVAVSPSGKSWALNPSGTPMELVGKDWQAKSGTLKQIAVGNVEVLGVSSDAKSWKWNPNSAGPLYANSLELTPNSVFSQEVVPGSNGLKFGLKAQNGKYVGWNPSTNQLTPNVAHFKEWETFTLETSQRTPSHEPPARKLFMDDNDMLRPQPHGNYQIVTGINGEAIQYSGSGYANVEYSKDLDAHTGITLGAWVKLDNRSGNYQTIVRRSPDEANKSLFQVYTLNLNQDNTRLSFTLTNGNASNANGSTITADRDFPLNTWVHVGGTWDNQSQQMKLYMNGEEVASGIFNNQIGVNKEPLYVGSAQGTGGFFHGAIDQVTLFKTSRPQSYFQERSRIGFDVLRNYMKSNTGSQQVIRAESLGALSQDANQQSAQGLLVSPSSDMPIGLRAVNGNRYISAINGGGGQMRTNAGALQAWERLILVPLDNNQVAIRTESGRYFSVKSNRDVFADVSASPGPWERFEVQYVGNGRVSIRSVAHNSYFVADSDEYLKANRSAVGEWEQFIIEAR